MRKILLIETKLNKKKRIKSTNGEKTAKILQFFPRFLF